MISLVRTLPSIPTGTFKNLQNIDLNQHVIIQEKIDGSQLTIFKKDGQLHFYNRNKPIDPQRRPFLNAWLSLKDKLDLFQEGWFYHGEAMTGRLTNTCEYQRVPKYYWIVYEIVRSDNSMLTPAEMEEALEETGLETVPLLYDSYENRSENLVNRVKEIMNMVEQGEITSGLGNLMEGIVVKIINLKRNDKIVNTRYKFVRAEFAEANHRRKKKLPELPANMYIVEIGKIYNTNARRQKAIQHLRERGVWREDNVYRNMNALVEELDRDLIKEAEEDIKNMLFVRFWPQISRIARGNLSEFLDSNVSSGKY